MATVSEQRRVGVAPEFLRIPVKIIVENVEQKYTGIETIIFKDKMIYGTNYDGQTLHKIDLTKFIK